MNTCDASSSATERLCTPEAAFDGAAERYRVQGLVASEAQREASLRGRALGVPHRAGSQRAAKRLPLRAPAPRRSLSQDPGRYRDSPRVRNQTSPWKRCTFLYFTWVHV